MHYCLEHNYKYFEVSSLNNQNIQELFESFIIDIDNSYTEEYNNFAYRVSISLDEPELPKKECC